MSHNSIETEIDSVHSQLLSSKVTQRKEGLKKLNVLLDSKDFLQVLDDNTLSTPTAGKIKVGTWPGLCVSIVDYAATEVSASVGKKKGPDAAISKVLRRFVQLADDDRRTGRRGLLAKKAAKLFVHVKDIIAQTSLASPIGQEYSALLRAHLLPVPQYCNVVSSITFQELLDMYMGKLEEQLDRSEDSFRNMSSLLLLLQHFPADMEPLFQQDMVTFFTNQLPVINQLREDSRISTAFMTALNSFLLKNGLDVSSRSADLQQALQPFLLRAWKSSRDQKLKDAFVICLNTQIRLGGIRGTSGAAVEIQGLLDKEISAASFKWGSEDRNGQVQLSRQADSLLQLTAAVWHLALSGSPGTAGAGPSPPQSKKLKVAPPSQRLHEQAMELPLQWAPVLVMLVHNHRHHIPQSAYTDWLQAVHSHSFEGDPEPAATFWLLRYLHELALAWPAALTAAEDDSHAAGDVSIAQLEGCWKAVWDSVLTWLSSTTSKAAVQEQGVALLAVIADRSLASSLQPRSPQLWSLPVLQQSPLTSAEASLICPAFIQGATASDQEKALQQSLLKRVLTDSAPHVPPQLLVQAAAALTSTAMPHSNRPTMFLHDWRQEGEDDSLQQQLDALVRGEEWMARSAQQAKETYQTAAAAKRLATSPSQSTTSEDAGPRQKLAGQLLQQQLQLLTVDSQEADSALLTKLLQTCIATVALVAADSAAAGGSAADTSAQGMIAEALQLALKRVSSLIVSLSEGGKALPSRDLALLNNLVDALRSYPYTRHAATLNNALLACTGQLERIFKDADNVVLSSLASSVQMTAGPGPATQAAQASPSAVGMFDDDLDLGAPVVAAAGAKRPRSAGPGTSSLASSCRMTCLTLITSIGMLDPNTAIPTILHLIHHTGSAHLKPAPELVQRALQCLCSLVATAEGCSHIRQATAALAGEPDGLLAHNRFQRDEVLLVLQQLSQLAKAFLAHHGSSACAGQWSEAVQEDLDAMMTVLEEVMRLIAAAESKDDKCTTWQIRVQLATCILDLVLVDTQVFGDELLSVCLEKVTKLLSDDMYFARREGAGLATVLYAKWTRPQSVFDDLKQQLKLRSLASGSHAAEHMESDILMLGETAAASGLLEREAVFLMCAHAAQQPSDIGLVGAALDMLAARLTYPSRSSLLAFHMRALIFDWCSHDYSIQQFLAVQELVAVDERGARDERALLTSYMHDLLAVLLLDQREEQLQEVATLLGMDEKSLLQKCLSSIIGSALPYTETGDIEERTLANTVTAGGLLLKHLTEEERNKLFHSKVVSVISTMLLTASDEPAAARPSFPIQTVLAAINNVPNQKNGQKNQDVLWSQVLRGDAIGMLLLSCHQQLSRTKHPRHARLALAPLKALLTLLGDGVTVPSTFRYATTILLQQLSSREKWADCCRLLQSILDKMLKQRSSLDVLGAHLQTILASLMASLQCNMDTTPPTSPAPLPGTSNTLVADEVVSVEPVVKLVLSLTAEAPHAVQPYLRDVEPLLPLPQLEPACRLHQQLREGLSLAEELQHFAGRAKSMSSAMRHRSLAALTAALPARKHQLFQPASTGHAAAFLPRVEEATWRLVWLSGETQDSALATFAGELLALAGPLDPSAIAFKPACAPQTHQLSNNSKQATAGQDSSSSSSSTASSLSTMMVAALQLMADYLVDPDVLVIRSVQFTLRNLLATQLGRDAFAQLDAVTQGYLQVYRREGVSTYRPSSKDASDPKWSPQNNPRLWSVQGQSYESWVRNLAYAMLLLAKEPTLAMCQHMIVRKAQLAELMLPHILADIAQHDTDSSVRSAISSQLSVGLLSPIGAPHIKARQLVLTCLDHLRNLHLDAVLGLDPDRPKGVSGAAGSGQGRVRSGRGGSGEGSNSPATWSKQYWLDIDYLQVAAAALQCSAYFTALLYVEHWIEEQCGRLKLDGCSLADKGSQAKADQLLLEVYSSINEPDGIYAVARGHSMMSQLKLYEHEGSWDKALAGYDMLCHRKASQHGQAVSSPSPPYTAAQDRAGASVSGQQGLLTSLQQLGCRHLIEAYWQSQPGSLSEGDSRSAEMRYESAWRMGQWQSCAEMHSAVPGRPVGTNEAVLGCLKALSNGDRERCRSLLFDARQNVIMSLATVSTESVSNVNPAILQLQQLQCLQEAWNFKWTSLSLSSSPTTRQAEASSTASEGRLSLVSLQSTWRGREAAIGAGDKYELREPLLAVRKAVLEAVGQPQQAAHTLHEAAVAARQTGHLTHAMAAAHQLMTTHTPDGGASSKFAWRVEEAKLLWAQGQQAVAVSMSRSLLEGARQNKQHDMLAYARLLSLTGKWLAETRFESSSAILASMGEAADALVMSGMHTGQVACRVMYRLAHHADTLYAGIQAQRQSAEWHTAQAVIKQKRQQVSLLQQQLQLRKQRGEVKKNAAGEVVDRESRVLLYQINNMMRPIQFDEEESSTLQDSKARYLLLALTNYHRCLLAGGRYDLQVVFRLFQLWFTLGSDKGVNEQLAVSFREVPSYKLLSLVYQIASRMSAAKSGPYHETGFQVTLQRLLQRLALEHPHNTLYQLFALKNGNRGKDGRAVQAGDVVGGMAVTVDHDKVAAAQDLISIVSSNPARKAIVEQVNQLIEAYIHLAALPASSDGAPMTFPSSMRRRIRDLNLVPVVSAPVQVDPSCRYDSLPHFSHFGDSISFVGGINKPKLIQCFDSAGHCHRQLVKSGNDDMRQDAVMQQFFALINDVLQESPDTQKRKLRIVTYKVVPFSPASGLLEWVEDTIPVHEYLTGKDKHSGAHKRYKKPADLPFAQCLQAMHKAKRSELRQTFDHVTAHFSPVLHHFFLETFRHPAHWFERRLQYTRSVAVNSMAGYIIGLGDRHSHNILLDRKTAEVVHIDLGVAFEQGRFLNTPELVPFRLTSNIVDGMGATGVEGVMRSCCEKTLGVLRQNKESLIIIIEVFIHDPLYKWALTPLGAQQRQKDDLMAGDSNPADPAGTHPSATGLGPDAVSGTDTTLANADAERALLRLKQKLAGMEGGQGEARGSKGQVQQLLQDAQNPDKLCKMYVGWSAWL